MDYAVILAGGKGLRMGSNIPKQFLPVNGLPVIMRTIIRFREYNPGMSIILVLPDEQQDYWKEQCRNYHFTDADTIISGGETRFHSVKNALTAVPDDACGVVGVHDGVRPFPSIKVIDKCYETARETGAAVPVTHVVDTLRILKNGSITETVERDNFRLVQTPQVFNIKMLKRAYEQPFSPRFTDDASVVENMGERVTIVEGNRENIKITTPFDLRIARILA